MASLVVSETKLASTSVADPGGCKHSLPSSGTFGAMMESVPAIFSLPF